ncbi:MAG: xanthine permease [Calditrichaeota bacterium]|nr:MAG: xanthine permease [Calditrichota bacterium]
MNSSPSDTPSPPQDAVWETTYQVTTPHYKIDERPASVWESLLYGWQHTLVDISPFILPLAIAGAVQMTLSEKAQFINYCLFAMGIATLIQTTIGNRLPIIQGPSATLTGTMTPIAAQMGLPAMWGAVFTGALMEMLVGASRVLVILKKFFPPAVAGVVIVCIGLSLGQLAIKLTIGDGHPINFVYAALVILSIFLLQLRFSHIMGGILARGSIFLSIWIIGLGVGSILQDVKWEIVASKPWIAFPGFFPYGNPIEGWEYHFAAILAVMAGYLGSMVESLGDYAATCAVSGEVYQVKHMNRGIFAEGLGSAVAALFGGIPCTSYTQNIGIIATTRVASRFIVQIAAIILILYGICPKFGALLVAMPSAVLGGVFIIVCGMIIISGLRLLQSAPSTTANFFLTGVTLVIATGVPIYSRFTLGKEWLENLPAFLRLLSTNTVVLAVFSSISLNIILNFFQPTSRGKEDKNSPANN